MLWQKLFLNIPFPASFSFIFGLFQTNNAIFTINKCEKCPSSIQCWDSNPRPLEHESSPITTRLCSIFLCFAAFVCFLLNRRRRLLRRPNLHYLSLNLVFFIQERERKKLFLFRVLQSQSFVYSAFKSFQTDSLVLINKFASSLLLYCSS